MIYFHAKYIFPPDEAVKTVRNINLLKNIKQ